MITKVTLTGADDSIEPTDLVDLSRDFPFVEWGILVSKANFGKARFPSQNWLRDLSYYAGGLQLSCHLCGRYVREFVKGNDEAVNDMEVIAPELWDYFQRVQLNFHSIPHESTQSLAVALKHYADKEFIFQHDGVNEHIVLHVSKMCENVSVLFDRSGGAGVLPDEWPSHLGLVRCGYAGGLSPDNVTDQIYNISKQAGEHKIWIDAETHVRSLNDKQFDLNKCRAFLEACNPFVQQ